ncbi:MAG: DNA replication/repair protein RecF [Actinomycetota bacterium]|nr:DNA replication/repair protein RecF [Actinomycetota bacterium]
MQLAHLWLVDFRNYALGELAPPNGLTVVVGSNGEGKTNLLEAIGYLATLRSFRGAPGDALVREGAPFAVVRAEVRREGRAVLVEAELRRIGRDRVQLNGRPLRRARDLLGALQVTVFSPDDLELVKGGPSGRRRYLDDLLVALHPRHDLTQTELDRVLRQRNALLRSARGRATPDVLSTLDVWDVELASAGEALVRARRGLTAALEPIVSQAYRRLAEGSQAGGAGVGLEYVTSWEGRLADALRAARAEDLRRGLSTVGPHRDDLVSRIGGMPSRTHASQGEQRSLALSLRLGGHELVTERIGSSPVLLLDDVFSELDPGRSSALLQALPLGQTLLSTTTEAPPGSTPDLVVRVDRGRLLL